MRRFLRPTRPLLAGLLTVAFLFSCAVAAAADAKGKIKSVAADRSEVAMVDDAGKNWTITAAKDCKVSLNNKASKLEDLQADDEIEAMRAGIARRVLDLLTRLAKEEKEKYASLWKEFGQVLKEGIAEDGANRERIATLLRFATTHDDREAQEHSLEAYLARMPTGQKHVYYVLAETFNAARQSPHLEQLRAKGIEVLLLSDRVDEWMMSYLGEYQGKSLRDVSRVKFKFLARINIGLHA